MTAYIEKDPVMIKAIKKSISHWNDVCFGAEGDIESKQCALCMVADGDCESCPLSMAGDECNNYGSKWHGYRDKFSYITFDYAECFCGENTAEEAEAMLEALVQLLPPEHRKEYGG